jgi:long-chain acyl-CoA synthetase
VICCEAGTQAITPNSVGPALPFAQMYVMDNAGKELPPERLGEIYVKGPNLMVGYFNPQAPDQPFVGKLDGWFRTEDLGLVDKNGNFHILDRREDALVLSNGKMRMP